MLILLLLSGPKYLILTWRKKFFDFFLKNRGQNAPLGGNNPDRDTLI